MVERPLPERITAADPRTLRILQADITQAKSSLCAARQDGNCEAIRKAAKHLDEKLDRYFELTNQGTV